ncbi:MAG: tRNA (adenosine(37)-N6)-dimethylallyltransferase MiaA [Firmicutes bacterium]|nr:tRNA (adenosine(37)-N6)-dimethylallyltransferase MiaA [Bacillota bacterium]
MIKLLALLGPTAVGKTKIAMDICKKLDGEIVSCDSMQIYRGMDIGSAKPSKDEQKLVKHHLIDIKDPEDEFSVADFSKLARETIEDISSRGKLPVLSGGTGLYIDSIIYDMDFAAAPPSSSKRDEYYKLAEEDGPEALHDILKSLDSEIAERIHPNNIKRVVRAIESLEEGMPINDFSKALVPRECYDVIMVGLMREREELYDRINKRVDIMMDAGLLDEVKTLVDRGLTENAMSMKGIGYKEIIAYLNGEASLEDAINDVKTNSRHYAKRQITWLKKYGNYGDNPLGIKWFNISESGSEEETALEIEEWLKRKL